MFPVQHNTSKNEIMKQFLLFGLIIFFVPMAFASEEADKLAAVMNDTNISLFAKTLACKQAAQNGTKDSAAVLAPFLADETLSHPARIALERIPDPAAGAALREYLGEVKGKLLTGILQSLGERREAQSTAAIVPFLDNADTETVYAAAAALGKIGSPEALSALQTAFRKAATERKALLVDGLYGCAEVQNTAAQSIYASINSQTDLSGIVRGGAVRGEILTAGTDAPKCLETFLADADDAIFTAALEASREVKTGEATQSILAVLPKLSAERQTLLISAIGDRADITAESFLVETAKNAAVSIKHTAIRALYSIPSDTVAAALFEFLADTDPQTVAAAIDALVRTKDDKLEQKIIQHLGEAKDKKIIPLAEVCRRRKIAAATPILLPHLNHSDADVRRAVFAALGYTVSGEDVGVLVQRLLHPNSKAEFDAVLGSLQAVCSRTVDQNAVAAQLAKDYESASVETQCEMLKLLKHLGGSATIETVRKATESPSEAIQDAATQVLGDWPDVEAAPVLLGIITKGESKFLIRALRGYIRIIRQMDTSNQHRYKMTLDALAVARRDEEKLLLIDALGRIPLPEALAKLTEIIDVPQFTEAVCTALTNSARPIVKQHREAVVKAMQLVAEKSKNADRLRIAKEIADEAATP